MKATIGIAQVAHPEDGNVLSMVKRIAGKASASGVDLLIFPEYLMTSFQLSINDFQQAAQPLSGPFCTTVNEIARSNKIWIAYTANEENPSDAKPYNTLVIVDDNGCFRGAYRKMNLFDLSDEPESDRTSAGVSELSPIQTPFGTIGAGICFDLRFPEIAEHAAAKGADIMLYPAGWVDGPDKVNQWQQLLTQRATENEMFVIGACRTGAGYTGHSMVIAPDGSVLAQAEREECLLIAYLER